ncbi:hypothetical protein HZC27_02940 [Candidatus Roizmanbacteria bacterium]|nr:hypothetical protein [Candidatus Roizmanbacteria bacterium]
MDTYIFDPIGVAEETGFHDPLIYNFSAEDIHYTLTREAIQNIVDAKDLTQKRPARAEFEIFKMFPKSLPDAEKLTEIYASCWRQSKDDKDEEAEDFFKKAYDHMHNNISFNVMKISDYNTTGLYGDENDRGGAYYKLMKMAGSSNKTEGMGGSHGLGKGAYFRPSLFRTIFVSSIWEKNQHVFQGKLRLVSHKQNDVMKQGIGVYSSPAVRDSELIPKEFRREKQGTSIYILGFEDCQHWQKRMVESVLRYFWLAIHDNLLEVRIGDSFIDYTNIEDYVYDFFSAEDLSDAFNPISYLKAYKEGELFEQNLPVIGNVKLRILMQKNYPKRIEFFRNTGMVIQNKGFNIGKGFAGVFFTPDENGILRKMEDPTHSKWSKDVPSRIKLEDIQKYAKAEKELNKFIRSTIKSLITTVDSTESNIKDLDKYFYSPAEDNNPDEQGNPESIEGQIKKEQTGSLIRGADTIKKSSVINIQVTLPQEVKAEPGGGGFGGGVGGGEGGGKKGQGHPDPEGKQWTKINNNITFVRSFVTDNGAEFEHVVFITGNPNDKFDMEVRIGTEDSFDEIDLKKVVGDNGENYKFKNNLVTGLVIPENKKLKLRLVFGIPGKYSLNLRAYESQ